MKCYNCGNNVPIAKDLCEYCGEDLRILQKAYRLSNSYYNMGLAKAKVRDLSGAILVLKKSLEINKRNTDARNLLGLIYFEMGEVVAALSEWVISKHLNSNSKLSDYYIEAVRSNPTKLDVLSQSIKKYNAALGLANQGDDDLAIIQLKKVINLNPNFVRASQLIGLLYINNKEYDKAFRYLNRVRKIDVSNTTTLKYLKEIETYASETIAESKKQARKERKQEVRQESIEASPFVVSPYKEEKPNIGLFVSLIAGIVIGIIASVILIVPTVRDEAVNQFRDAEVEYNAEISKKEQEISSLEKEKTDLEERISSLEDELEQAKATVEQVTDNSAYDNLLRAATLYLAGTTNNSLDYIAIADAISQIDTSDLDSTDALNLYNQIKDDVYLEAADELYDQGHRQYSRGKYDEALEALLQSYEYNNTNVNTIYFIGRTYHRMDNHEKAREFYTILTDEYPATNRAKEAKSRLRDLE